MGPGPSIGESGRSPGDMRILVPFMGLAALTGLCWLCVRDRVPAVEADLGLRSRSALAAQDLDRVHVEVKGLHVRLSGTTMSAGDRDRAEHVVTGLTGVRSVENSITILPTRAQPESTSGHETAPAADPPGVAASPARPEAARPRSTAGDPHRDSPKADLAGSSAAERDDPSSDETETVPARPSRAPVPVETTPSSQETPRPDTAAASESADPVKACQGKIDALLEARRIQFITASSGLTEASMPLLDALAGILLRYPEVHLEIAGHTDSRGIEDLNLRLSQARAEAVRSYLIKRGISPSRLVAIGFGASRPIALNDTEEGRFMNRRIEFYVRGDRP